MGSPVNYTLTDNIGVISVDNPPVNALSQAVRQGLLDAFADAAEDASAAVLLICEGRTFIAGADISEFGKPLQEPWLPRVVGRVARTSSRYLATMPQTSINTVACWQSVRVGRLLRSR